MESNQSLHKADQTNQENSNCGCYYFSREKQRLIKSDQLKTSSSSPANSDVEIDGIGRIALVTKQVTDAEAKLKKHR